MDFQKQFNLRSRNVVVDPPKKALVNQASTSQSTKNIPNKQVQQKNVGNDLPKENISKEKYLQKDEVKKNLIVVEKNSPSFSLQNELSKIKIFAIE